MHGYGVGRFTAKCRRRAAAPRCLLAFYILDALLPSSAFSSLSPRITLFAIRTPRYLSFRAVHIDRPARARGTGIRVKPPFLTRLDDPLPRSVSFPIRSLSSHSLVALSASSLAGSLSSLAMLSLLPRALGFLSRRAVSPTSLIHFPLSGSAVSSFSLVHFHPSRSLSLLPRFLLTLWVWVSNVAPRLLSVV